MKVLVAGIGNIFFGDDAFGVEVVRRLHARNLPAGVTVRDFGLRGFDLASCIAEPWDLIILVDAVRRGGPPGSVYVIEIDPAARNLDLASSVDPHGLDPAKAIELAGAMGEVTARLLLVGCEPENLATEEGLLGLSAPVTSAVEEAVERIERILSGPREGQHRFESQSGARA